MSKDEPKKEAVIYTRFSPRRNAEESESSETQLAYCREYCRQRGYVVIAEYDDPEKSGGDAARPALWAAVEDCTEGRVLVAYKTDRLARELYLHECIRRAVYAAGATIEAVQGDIPGDRPEDNLIRQVLAAFSEYERKIISIRTRYAMIHHQKHGRRMGSVPPYGQQPDPNNPNRWIVHPEEAAAVEQIAQWSAEGASYCEIVRRLDHSEFISRGAEGRWNHKTVRAIVARERRYGRL